MALYPIDRDPGPWQQFVKRSDVKDLSLNEQKSQFLKEQLQFQDFLTRQSIMNRQYQDYISNQVNGGGEDITNGVEQISFSTNAYNTIAGFTANIFYKFIEPVVVETGGGIPTVGIINNQDGAGATTPIVFTYNAALSEGPVVGFSYTQAAAAGNNGAVAASTIGTTTNFATSPTSITQPTKLTSGSFTVTGLTKGVGYTIAPDTLAQDAVLTVTTSTDADDSTANLAITAITPTTEGFGALPGDVITFAAGALGTGFLKNADSVTDISALIGGTLKTGAGTLTATKNFTSVTGGGSQTGTGGSVTVVSNNAGAITSVTVNSVGANYVSGNVLTISATELASTTARADGLANVDMADGATTLTVTLTATEVEASVGGAFTIAAAQLTPDVLTTAGTTISENGGAIYDAGTDPADELNLDYSALAAVNKAAFPA
jgi:hypothetical protein